MFVINFDPENGKPIADDYAEKYLLECHKSRLNKITVCNEIVILVARCLIKEGVFPQKETEIQYKGTKVEVNTDGTIDVDWPDGFCGMTYKCIKRLF